MTSSVEFLIKVMTRMLMAGTHDGNASDSLDSVLIEKGILQHMCSTCINWLLLACA